MILKNIPNALTLFRLALIAPFLLFLYQQEYDRALYIFFLAGFTDGLDGWLARHFHWQSLFGSIIDPLADKLLVISSFVSLYLIGILPGWLVLIVFIRDACILLGAFLWFWFIQRKFDFEPTLLSKINTTVQLGLVTFCLFELAYFVVSPVLLGIVIAVTTFTTMASFIDYMRIWSKKAWLVKYKCHE
jgi:cardiolipin synthase